MSEITKPPEQSIGVPMPPDQPLVKTAQPPAPPVARTPGQIIADLFIKNNVFYLLSALFMIIGCWLVLAPFQQVTRTIWDLLIYFAIVNAYEVLLIATAIYVIVKKKVFRDGVLLLGIEAVFLADATLINSVYYLHDTAFGFIINGVILIMAFIKIFIVVKYLNLSFPKAFYRFLIFGLTFLYLFTGDVSYGIKLGFDRPKLLFIIYTIAGLIPLALLGMSKAKEIADEPFKQFRQKTQIIFPLIILGMILIHLFTVNWILASTFYMFYLTPFLIIFAMVLPELVPAWGAETKVRHIQWIIPIIALLFALDFPDNFSFEISPYLPVFISPLRLNLILAGLVFGYYYIRALNVLFIIPSSLFLLFASMGYDTEIIAKSFGSCFKILGQILPRTAKGWGITSMIAALALFGAGFWVSLKKSKTKTN